MESAGRSKSGEPVVGAADRGPDTAGAFVALWDLDQARAAERARSLLLRLGRARGRREDDAEDDGQSAMERLVATDAAGVRRMREGVLLAAALAGYLRNLRRESGRRTLRTVSLREDDAGEPADALAGDASSAAAAAEREVRLGELSPGQRDLVALLHDGLSLAEAAATLGISAGAARMRHWRALQRLTKRHLGGSGRAVAAATVEVARSHAEAARARAWASEALTAAGFAGAADRCLLTALAAGRFIAEIAESLGMSRSAVESRCARLRRRWRGYKERRGSAEDNSA